MEAVQYLAWHLVHCCGKRPLYEKLVRISPNDRRNIVGVINWGLENGKNQKTILKSIHLQEISKILTQGNEEEIEELYFNLSMYVLALEVKKNKETIDKLLYGENSQPGE